MTRRDNGDMNIPCRRMLAVAGAVAAAVDAGDPRSPAALAPDGLHQTVLAAVTPPAALGPAGTTTLAKTVVIGPPGGGHALLLLGPACPAARAHRPHESMTTRAVDAICRAIRQVGLSPVMNRRRR